MRSCLASRRSVSGWGLVTHGAMALQPNELESSGRVPRKGAILPQGGGPAPSSFRFRFMPRKVPGLSANPLGFRGGRGTKSQEKEAHVLRNRPLARSREPCYFLLWFLGIPAHSASGRLSLPSPSSPPPPLPPPLLPPLPPPLPPPHLRPNQGGGIVVDLPYQMHNNYES